MCFKIVKHIHKKLFILKQIILEKLNFTIVLIYDSTIKINLMCKLVAD